MDNYNQSSYKKSKKDKSKSKKNIICYKCGRLSHYIDVK